MVRHSISGEEVNKPCSLPAGAIYHSVLPISLPLLLWDSERVIWSQHATIRTHKYKHACRTSLQLSSLAYFPPFCVFFGSRFLLLFFPSMYRFIYGLLTEQRISSLLYFCFCDMVPSMCFHESSCLMLCFGSELPYVGSCRAGVAPDGHPSSGPSVVGPLEEFGRCPQPAAPLCCGPRPVRRRCQQQLCGHIRPHCFPVALSLTNWLLGTKPGCRGRLWIVATNLLLFMTHTRIDQQLHAQQTTLYSHSVCHPLTESHQISRASQLQMLGGGGSQNIKNQLIVQQFGRFPLMLCVKPMEHCALVLLVSGQYGGSQAWEGKRLH